MAVEKPQSYDELFPGRFLKADLFKGREVTLRIADAYVELMPDKKGRVMVKGERHKKQAILVLETPQGRKLEQELALNKTNGLALVGMFGKAVRGEGGWVGRLVTFAPRRVDAFGEETDAIRVIGSPEIASDMTFTKRVGRADRTFKMKKTPLPAQVKLVQPPPNPTAGATAPRDDTLEPEAEAGAKLAEEEQDAPESGGDIFDEPADG